MEEAQRLCGRAEPLRSLATQSLTPGGRRGQGLRRWYTAKARRTGIFFPYLKKFMRQRGEVLGTRATAHQYELIKQRFPEVQYDAVSRILKLEKNGKRAYWQGCCMHCGDGRYPGGGGSGADGGIFRHKECSVFMMWVSAACIVCFPPWKKSVRPAVLSQWQEWRGACQCTRRACEPSGHSGSHLGGIRASMNGLSALLTMINSCANGIAVVNIDNGYGAGYLATQINRLAAGKE